MALDDRDWAKEPLPPSPLYGGLKRRTPWWVTAVEVAIAAAIVYWLVGQFWSIAAGALIAFVAIGLWRRFA